MHIVEMDERPRALKEIDIQDIRILANIGKGSFGVVYKAIWKNQEVAVKSVESESEVAALHNEIQQLSRTCHENIIKVLGAYLEGPSHLLVMEFADGGSLYQLLHNPPYPPYTLAHALSWLLQCAKAVAYLHAIEPGPIIHRDLKPPNLLLSDGCRLLKVCDFGTACDLHTVMTDNTGSAAWMAPEVFETKRYSEKCDVYSWGIILWEVLTRRVPFLELGQAYRIMWAVHTKRRPPLIVGCPKLLENLMKRCWDHAANKRPSMEEVVATVPQISRFLRGADEPIQFPSPTDTGSSYVSPTTGDSSSERRSSSEEVGGVPSTLSSTTFVAPDPHDTSDQSSLNPSLAGPPEVEGSEHLVPYDQYWKFTENQQAWMESETMDDSDAARSARRQRIEEEIKCFPPPPAGHPAFISPNATANIIVSPENLISPCSTLRSEECMEPYKLPMPVPSESYSLHQGQVLSPVSVSKPEASSGQFSSSWVPVGCYQGLHVHQQQQLLQFQQHALDARGSSRRSPLTLKVGLEHELVNSEDVTVVSCGDVMPPGCMPCTSSTVVTMSSAASSVVTTSVVTAVAASSSSGRGGASVTGVQLRPKRPGYLNPKDCDAAFSSSCLRRRSAEVSALQYHPANQPGHRRSNSSGTLTSLVSGEALPPPAPPVSPAAAPPSVLGRPAATNHTGRGPSLPASGDLPSACVASKLSPVDRDPGKQRPDFREHTSHTRERSPLSPSIPVFSTKQTAVSHSPSSFKQLASPNSPNSPLVSPTCSALSVAVSPTTAQAVQSNHHFQQHKYHQHHHHLSPVVCSYPQLNPACSPTTHSHPENSSFLPSSNGSPNHNVDVANPNSSINDGALVDNRKICSATCTSVPSNCVIPKPSRSSLYLPISPICISRDDSNNSIASDSDSCSDIAHAISHEISSTGIITIGAIPCLGYITETLTTTHSIPPSFVSSPARQCASSPIAGTKETVSSSLVNQESNDGLSLRRASVMEVKWESATCCLPQVDEGDGELAQSYSDDGSSGDFNASSSSPVSAGNSSMCASPSTTLDSSHGRQRRPERSIHSQAPLSRLHSGVRSGRFSRPQGPLLLTPIKETVAATIDLPILRKLDTIPEPLKRHSSEYDEAYITAPITDALDELTFLPPSSAEIYERQEQRISGYLSEDFDEVNRIEEYYDSITSFSSVNEGKESSVGSKDFSSDRASDAKHSACSSDAKNIEISAQERSDLSDATFHWCSHEKLSTRSKENLRACTREKKRLVCTSRNRSACSLEEKLPEYFEEKRTVCSAAEKCSESSSNAKLPMSSETASVQAFSGISVFKGRSEKEKATLLFPRFTKPSAASRLYLERSARHSNKLIPQSSSGPTPLELISVSAFPAHRKLRSVAFSKSSAVQSHSVDVATKSSSSEAFNGNELGLTTVMAVQSNPCDSNVYSKPCHVNVTSVQSSHPASRKLSTVDTSVAVPLVKNSSTHGVSVSNACLTYSQSSRATSPRCIASGIHNPLKPFKTLTTSKDPVCSSLNVHEASSSAEELHVCSLAEELSMGLSAEERPLQSSSKKSPVTYDEKHNTGSADVKHLAHACDEKQPPCPTPVNAHRINFTTHDQLCFDDNQSYAGIDTKSHFLSQSSNQSGLISRHNNSLAKHQQSKVQPDSTGDSSKSGKINIMPRKKTKKRSTVSGGSGKNSVVPTSAHIAKNKSNSDSMNFDVSSISDGEDGRTKRGYSSYVQFKASGKCSARRPSSRTRRHASQTSVLDPTTQLPATHTASAVKSSKSSVHKPLQNYVPMETKYEDTEFVNEHSDEVGRKGVIPIDFSAGAVATVGSVSVNAGSGPATTGSSLANVRSSRCVPHTTGAMPAIAGSVHTNAELMTPTSGDPVLSGNELQPTSASPVSVRTGSMASSAVSIFPSLPSSSSSLRPDIDTKTSEPSSRVTSSAHLWGESLEEEALCI
ncbi:Serine-threonine/tyrosine-protein kinase catalytic domain [Trinorchestia longiramus]|nr:Serine-threonine/tyrosine-protein kinase catalytic domain [Trinorchestia longiramus]